MRLSRGIALAWTAFLLGVPEVVAQGQIRLLQPLDGGANTINAAPGIQIVFDYFNRSWPFLLGTVAGLAVLQALVGGIQIMMSGGDGGKRENGKSRLIWALAGLLMIAFAGMILHTLNPLFYQ